MSRYLFVHPEGNVNTNPCLSDMVAILCERGHHVTILSPRRPGIAQSAPCARAELRLFEPRSTTEPFPESLAESGDSLQAISSLTGAADIVVGVDRGILDASRIARAFDAPLVLVSFEIFFEDEAGRAFKLPEREACRDVQLAICQDDLRASHLSRENGIPLSRIRMVPVAGRSYKGGDKTDFWHRRFGIPPGDRIALFMGSISEWSHAPFVLTSAARWTAGWHLVMHHRYSGDLWVLELMRAFGDHPRIHFSDQPFDTIAAMRPALLGADLGLAFYRPLAGALYEGHNLEAIGMASGKIAVYLQHGLPVAVNEIGEMSRYVRERGLGVVVDTSVPLAPVLPPVLPSAIPEFFEDVLDLDRTFEPVARELEAISGREKPGTPSNRARIKGALA